MAINSKNTLISFLVLLLNSTMLLGQCDENLLTNGGFEDGNLNAWISTGISLIQSDCHSAEGNNYLWHNSTASTVSQIVPGEQNKEYLLSFYDGAHAIDGQKVSLIFLDDQNTELSRLDHLTSYDVDLNGCQLEFNSLNAMSPAGTATVKIEISINNAGLKTDGFCLELIESNIEDPCEDWQQGPSNSILMAGVIINPGVIDSSDDIINMTLVLANLGEHALIDITHLTELGFTSGEVVDVTLNPVFSGDPNGNGQLDPGEIWFYSIITTLNYDEGDTFICSYGASAYAPCGLEIGGAADVIFTYGVNMDINID